MSIFTTVRDRYFPRASSGSQSTNGKQDSEADASAPFAGYDRLDSRQVMDGLSKHSQIDLETIESYERAHKSRDPVLDKLRYMRGREPLAGYDALSAEEVVTALEEADMTTIKGVRSYERKFANRGSVLEEVVRVHHRRLAAQKEEANGDREEEANGDRATSTPAPDSASEAPAHAVRP